MVVIKERARPVYRIAEPIKTLGQRFAYAGLVGISITLLLIAKTDGDLSDRLRTTMTDAVAPLLSVLSQPTAAVADAVENAEHLLHLREDNATLRAERERLLQWQQVAWRLETENAALRGLLNFKAADEATHVAARVIADTGGAFAHSLILNAGTRDGLRKGAAVVTGEGMVGRVTTVGARSARVLLITDLNSRIPVYVEPSGARAILAGDNSDQPVLLHLPPEHALQPGDRVVTSGHGGAFPPYLPIGRVASAGDSVRVQLFVSRNQVDYVRVVDYGLDGILKLPQSTEREANR